MVNKFKQMKEDNKQETSVYVSAILEQTPNGVLLVDKKTLIHYVNPAFREMFHCSDEELLNQPAAKFVHSDCFERAISVGGKLMVKESIPVHNVSYRVGIFPIEGEDLYCGIFIDISEEEDAKKHYRDFRAQTLERAQEVISRQMKTAQEIARLLGETTAETKVLLVKLMSLFKEEGA
ncbi:MAG: PAS domain-containing protein [Spirochaetota bacterium]|nr:MAG: PAS domain-containing protein [Spirochaetota bacterium]